MDQKISKIDIEKILEEIERLKEKDKKQHEENEKLKERLKQVDRDYNQFI